MKYKSLVFIVLLLGLSLWYTWYEAHRPQPVDWSETYSPEDKIPYGTYILYQGMPQLFPEADISLSRLSLVEESRQREGEETAVYVFIGQSFYPEEAEIGPLLEWVGKGNQLFVAAEDITDSLLRVFSLPLEPFGQVAASRLLFSDAGAKSYEFHPASVCSFQPDSAFQGLILGEKADSVGKDFVCLPYQKGKIFFNLNPGAFTNVEVLDSVRGDYCYRALSCLPVDANVVVWAARHTLGSEGEQTPLRVIIHYPALQLALYLLLAGMLLYVLFKAKREQRPIPVIRPPENKMLEFIATVSLLYWRQKDHYAIALKQIAFLKEEIRRKYFWQVHEWDGQLADLLAEHSGTEKQKVVQLIDLIRDISHKQQVDEEQLKHLRKGIEGILGEKREKQK